MQAFFNIAALSLSQATGGEASFNKVLKDYTEIWKYCDDELGIFCALCIAEKNLHQQPLQAKYL